jgi:hypothetical protein
MTPSSLKEKIKTAESIFDLSNYRKDHDSITTKTKIENR